jgi:hypothetical protein
MSLANVRSIECKASTVVQSVYYSTYVNFYLYVNGEYVSDSDLSSVASWKQTPGVTGVGEWGGTGTQPVTGGGPTQSPIQTPTLVDITGALIQCNSGNDQAVLWSWVWTPQNGAGWVYFTGWDQSGVESCFLLSSRVQTRASEPY